MADLKKYRSEAEKIAVTQRNWQIALTLTNLVIVGMVALRTFGVL